jgi:NAD(P)-dependent dehydrogenase (short-subunit alcohol dehydrogenase family)
MLNILVTGASRGIGLEFCRQYLSQRHNVVACCRHPDKATDLQRLKSEYAEQLTIFALDITSEKSIAQLKNNLNQQAIDILINNAGIYQFDMSTDHLNKDIWQTFFATNSIGHYLITLALLENVQQSQTKKIINMSSNMGSIGLDTNGINIPYRASKAALNAITKSLSAIHQNDKLIIIAMHPGWVRTDMGGPHGNLSPQESVSMMVQQIESLSVEDSGKYFAYDGQILPW